MVNGLSCRYDPYSLNVGVGVCIPASCPPGYIEKFYEYRENTTGITVSSVIRKSLCQLVDEPTKLTAFDISVL